MIDAARSDYRVRLNSVERAALDELTAARSEFVSAHKALSAQDQTHRRHGPSNRQGLVTNLRRAQVGYDALSAYFNRLGDEKPPPI